MVKNVKSWISDSKAGALYRYIILPTHPPPREKSEGAGQLRRGQCLRSCEACLCLVVLFHIPTPEPQLSWPTTPPRATEPALTPSHDTAQWPAGCQGSATPTLSSWTRPSCPLQSGWFPCLSSTLSGQWHRLRAHLWFAALQEVKSAHWPLL